MSKNNGKPNKPLEVPSIGLSKTSDGQDPRWFKEAVAKHGDTDPLLLEKRRINLTAISLKGQDSMKKMTVFAKAAALEAANLEKMLEAELEKTPKDDPHRQQREFQLTGIKMQHAQNAAQNEAAIHQATMFYGLFEAQCQIVDSVTLREDGEDEQGVKGTYRMSAAFFAGESAFYNRKVYRILKRVYPDALKPEDVKEDEEEDQDAKIVPGELVTVEEKRRLTEEAGGDL